METTPEPRDTRIIMSNTDFPVLGFDVGGTKIAVCIALSSGEILESRRVDTGGRPYEEVRTEMLAAAAQLVQGNGFTREQIRACGISAPGPLDIRNGVMRKSPNLPWDDVPIQRDVAEGLGLPVTLINDASAGVLAEWLFGAAKGCRNALYLTMSTGIGGGILADGHLIQGATGNAGEIGHMVLDINGPLCGCGLRGCFEAFCGGRNVARHAQALLREEPDHAILKRPEIAGDLSKVRFETIRDAARDGVPLAVELWDGICFRIAQGIGLLMNVFNPELVILGTAALYAGDFMLDPVRRHLPRFAWKEMSANCEIRVTALGKSIGELAGASVALYGLYENGEWTPR
jgi:glucokinase